MLQSRTEYEYTTADNVSGSSTSHKAYGYGNTSWKDLLTSYDGQTITSDGMGNPLNYRDGITFTWKNGRQLASSKVGTIETIYNYDISGNRVYRAGGGFRHTYSVVDGVTLGEKIVFVGNGTTHYMEYMRDENGDVYGFIYDGSTYFLEKNALGDVKYLLDGSGNVLAKYTYDAYGKVVSVTDASGNAITDWANIAHLNPFRYRSYHCDFESGLYYLKSRYYDPVLCRFINADSILDNRGVNTLNLFAYCGNNPVSNKDSNGHLFGAIIGIGLLIVGVAAILGGCSSEPTGTPSATLTPPAPSATLNTTPSTIPDTTPSTTPPHAPTSQEKSYAATVYAEAGGQNKRSKQAVAHVINNRIGMRSTWTDIEAVISAKGQFNGYNSSMYRAAMDYYNNGICNNPIDQAAMDECLAVVIPICSGAESDITGGALYFHSYPNPSDWAYHNDFRLVDVPGTEKFWFYK